MIWIPPASRPNAKFQLVYHFHGTHSERVQAKAPGVPKKVWVGWDRLQQTLDAASELQTRRDYNVVLIYPISAGKRPEPGHKGWFNKEYDRIWMAAPESFDALHEQVAAILDAELGVPAASLLPRVIAEGHSAGGIALRNVAVAGSRRVGEYIFQDASFQGWADGCHAAVKTAGSDALVTIVLTDRGIADPFGKRDPWCLDLESDAKAWAGAKAWCADPARAKKRPAGGGKPCAELEAGAAEWEDYAAWCTALKDEMRDVPNVFLHRTKIPHGAQPRHFTGGLELPDPRP